MVARRGEGRCDAETLELSARLLELNPEVLTAWCLRRDCLAVLGADGARRKELLGAQLVGTLGTARALPNLALHPRRRRDAPD